jgi:hypothetical protein
MFGASSNIVMMVGTRWSRYDSFASAPALLWIERGQRIRAAAKETRKGSSKCGTTAGSAKAPRPVDLHFHGVASAPECHLPIVVPGRPVCWYRE